MKALGKHSELARIEKGTPAGDLLRRYWHPVGCAAELKDRPTKKIRILGEDLVLYRTSENDYGLIQEKCTHRCASLEYGFVDQEGIRCPYHGWKFDLTGQCIEQPFEQNRALQRNAGAVAYPVEEITGILFTYMGPPQSISPLPKWDILREGNGRLVVEKQERVECNWFQFQENAADVVHTYFLHAKYFEHLGIPDRSGFNRPWKSFGFQPFEWGLLKSWEYDGPDGGKGWGNPLVFPNILRLETEMHWRVPIDEVTTNIFWVTRTSQNENDPAIIIQPERKDENGHYRMDTFSSQDAMACETQGAFASREKEMLGASDAGIVMFRKMFQEQIEKLEKGERPMGIVGEDRKDEIVDLRIWMNGDRAMSCELPGTRVNRRPAEEVFDERFVEFAVPYGSARPGIDR